MTLVNMQKWRIKLPTRRRLEMKILTAKQFAEKFLIGANTAELSELMPDTSPEKQNLVILIVNNLMGKLIDAYLQLQKSLFS